MQQPFSLLAVLFSFAVFAILIPASADAQTMSGTNCGMAEEDDRCCIFILETTQPEECFTGGEREVCVALEGSSRGSNTITCRVPKEDLEAPPPSTTTPGATGSYQERYKPLEYLPGYEQDDDVSKLPNYLLVVFVISIAVVGIAVLFMLTVGGFMYIFSAGNASSAEVAKRIIRDSLVGLVVVFGSWLLLFVINPDLVQIERNLVFLRSVGVLPGQGGAGGAGSFQPIPQYCFDITEPDGTVTETRCSDTQEDCETDKATVTTGNTTDCALQQPPPPGSVAGNCPEGPTYSTGHGCSLMSQEMHRIIQGMVSEGLRFTVTSVTSNNPPVNTTEEAQNCCTNGGCAHSQTTCHMGCTARVGSNLVPFQPGVNHAIDVSTGGLSNTEVCALGLAAKNHGAGNIWGRADMTCGTSANVIRFQSGHGSHIHISTASCNH